MSGIDRTVIGIPRSAYIVVGFVAICMTALVRSPLQMLVYLAPVAAAVYVARIATIVDERGLTARGLLGENTLAWDELAGLRLDASGSVYAVDTEGGQLRLPCVRSTSLAPLAKASAGRIPDPAR